MIQIKSQTANNYLPVRYLSDSRSQLYRNFPFRNEISKATFYKYCKLSGQYKNPHRFVTV